MLRDDGGGGGGGGDDDDDDGMMSRLRSSRYIRSFISHSFSESLQPGSLQAAAARRSAGGRQHILVAGRSTDTIVLLQ